DMKNMDASIVWRWIGCPARLRRARRKHFGFGCRFRCSVVLDGRKELGIYRFASAGRTQKRHLIFIRVLPTVGVLAKQMTWDMVILSAQNLFTVIARIQPGIGSDSLSNQE